MTTFVNFSFAFSVFLLPIHGNQCYEALLYPPFVYVWYWKKF